jgi:DNA-directed RNA polymerase specialized sigma24 family protein
VQVTWLRLVENLDRITEPDALGSWLVTSVRRECLQLIRRTSRRRVIQQPETQDVPDPAPPVDHTMPSEELNG